MVKNLSSVQETWVQSLDWEGPMEKKMAAHSNVFVWDIPWIEQPGRLRSKRSQRVAHDLGTKQQTNTNLDE